MIGKLPANSGASAARACKKLRFLAHWRPSGSEFPAAAEGNTGGYKKTHTMRGESTRRFPLSWLQRKWERARLSVCEARLSLLLTGTAVLRE